MRKTGSVFCFPERECRSPTYRLCLSVLISVFFWPGYFFCAVFGTVAGDYQMEELETDLEDMYKTTYGKSPLKITKE